MSAEFSHLESSTGQQLPGVLFELFRVPNPEAGGIMLPLDADWAAEDDPDGIADPELILLLRARVPAEAGPGIFRGRLTINGDTGSAVVPLILRVHAARLVEPARRSPRVECWQPWTSQEHTNEYAPFSEPWWEYVTSAVTELGQSAGAVQIGRAYFDWTRVGPGRWQFDFSRFDRYVATCEAAGLAGPISYVGMFATTGPSSIHYADADGTLRSVACEPGSEFYDEAWAAFLHALVEHCKEQGRASRLVIWPADRPSSDDARARFAAAAELVRATSAAVRIAVTAEDIEIVHQLIDHVDAVALPTDAAMDLPAELRQRMRDGSIELLAYSRSDAVDPYRVALDALEADIDGLLIPDPVVSANKSGHAGIAVLHAWSGVPLPTVASEMLALGIQDAHLLALLPGARRTELLAALRSASADGAALRAARVRLLEAASRSAPALHSEPVD